MSLVQMKRKMQKGFAPFVYAFVGLFILSIFLTFGFSGGGFGGGQQLAGGTFGKIGGTDVSNAEFARYIETGQEQVAQMAQFGQPVTMQRQSTVPEQAYQQLLREYATAAAAEKYGIRVSTSEAERQARDRIDEQLKEVGKGSTAQEMEEIRHRMYGTINASAEQRRVLGERLRERVTQDAKPVEVKVAHVLIKTGGTQTDAEALKLATEVARQAKAGADFGELAKKHSEDEGSKTKAGVAGWASAQPDPSPIGKDSKPNPEAAQSFVQEFTAAALRLQKNQISDPVRSTYGYHVLKAVDVRDFKPKIDPPPAPKKGEKPKPDAAAKEAEKRQQAIESYRTQAGSTIAEGLVSAEQRRLEGQVQPSSNWLKGYLLNQKGRDADLPQVVAFYTAAMKENEPPATGSPQGFAYTLVDLHRRLAQSYESKKQKDKAAEQYEAALKLLDRYARSDAELLVAQGDIHLKMGDKTKALASYQKALDRARRNPAALGQLATKLKELGRQDLAAQANKKQGEQLAAEAAEQKARQEQFQKMIAEQMKQQAQEKAKEAATTTPPIQIKPGGGSVPIKVGGQPIEVKVGGGEGAKTPAAPKQ